MPLDKMEKLKSLCELFKHPRDISTEKQEYGQFKEMIELNKKLVKPRKI